MRMQHGAECRLLFCGLIVPCGKPKNDFCRCQNHNPAHGALATVPQAKPKIKPKPASRRRSTRLSSRQLRRSSAALPPHDPDPKGELEHSNPFTLLVAVVLSAQATDAGVNKATRALFAAADTPEKMVALGEERVREFVKTIGLYRNKAKNVVELSRQLIARHGSVVPADRDVLEELPGVGRKTANVVMNVAFGAATMAVDTHVFRVANRTGLSSGKNPLEVEADLLRVIPAAIRRAGAPLADPARPLRLQGAAAGVSALPD